ncbi:MAG: ABC transporter ATP-binding protein, partial [Acidimicrobiales bacterium]
LYRRLMAGSGDAETLTPDVALDRDGDGDAQVEGVTPSAWPSAGDVAPVDALAAVGRMGKAGPAAGPGGQAFVVESMAATPELLAQVAALQPARDRPDITVTDAATDGGPFSLPRFLRRWRRQLALAFGVVALDGLAALAGPVFVRYGIDRGVLPHAEHTLWLIAGLALAVVLADWAITIAEVFVTGRTAERVLYALRLRIFAHLQRLGLDFYDREMAGRIMTRMTNDVEALTQLLQTGLVNALVSAVTGVGVGVVLLLLDWRLALLTMMVAPPLAGATLWFRTSARRAYDQARDKVAAVNADFQESLSGVRVTQAFAREQRNARRFAGLALDYLRARVRGELVAATYFALVDLFSELAAAIVLGFGAALVSSGSVSAGTLIAFLLYLDLFFSPIQALSQILDTWQQAAVAIDRITELVDSPVNTPAAPRPRRPATRLHGDIAFCDVSFRYPGTEVEVLDGFTLTVPSGQTLALVGETGAGKSTIVKLIARFYDVTGGQVTVDGVDVRDYELTAYRHQLGIVPQESYLFAGTVRDNIAYGRPDASDAAVEAAARAVGAHQLVIELPGGYHHVIGSSGLTLSSGQRQLLALARAQLVDPAIVLLDEATSNLDPATDAAVARAMTRAGTGRTTVIIAHRLTTAARADYIAVVDHGQLVEHGPHDQLLRDDGPYAALWHTSPEPAPIL